MNSPSPDSPVIAAEGLVKRYGEVTAVDGIDLAIRRQEIFGLLGPNGAGKTTTLLMMIGLTDVTGGAVRVLGFDPAREPLEVKRRIGYMPDSVGFYDNLTARENLRYTARLAGLERRNAETRIADGLTRVGLDHVADRRVGTFSHGMRRRLGLAEIAIKKAEIAILDEPTSGLDPQATHEILDMIRGLKADGVTVLLSSHLLDQVQRICDRVALFNRGKVALIGTVPELAKKVLGGGYSALVEARGADVSAALSAVPGVRRVLPQGGELYLVFAERDVRGEIARQLASGGYQLLRLNNVEPNLDDIYQHYFEDARRAA